MNTKIKSFTDLIAWGKAHAFLLFFKTEQEREIAILLYSKRLSNRVAKPSSYCKGRRILGKRNVR